MLTMQNNRTIKQFARQMIVGHLVSAFFVLFILKIATSIPSLILNYFAPESAFFSTLYNMYVLLVSGPLRFGVAIFFLSCIRGNCIGLNAMGYAFDYFGKAAALYINIMFRTLIGTIFFIVPGIIMAIRYSQAFFVLADDPTKSVYACMNESSRIMQGKFTRFIFLYIGFIPLYFFANLPDAWATQQAVTAELSGRVVEMDSYLQAMQSVMSRTTRSPWYYLSIVFVILVDIYRMATLAGYFDIASGKLVFQTAEETEAEYTENDEE